MQVSYVGSSSAVLHGPIDNTGDSPFLLCSKSLSACHEYTLVCVPCSQCTYACHHGSICPHVLYAKLPKKFGGKLVLLPAPKHFRLI